MAGRGEDSSYLQVGGDEGKRHRAKRRLGYRVTMAVLTLIVGAAVLDAFTSIDAYGVSTDHVHARGGGYELDVRYATVTRPALASPFDIRVTRPGGFDGPVEIAVSASYLRLWDLNGIIPSPASEIRQGAWVVWEMDPPEEGDSLIVSYEARIEPAVQWGRRGQVAVFEDGAPVAVVDFETEVRP